MCCRYCSGTSNALKVKHGSASDSFAKPHWTKADLIKTPTDLNDNLTYRPWISCFARSTQIGLMYHHNPHNTQSELLPRLKCCLAGMWGIVTVRFPLAESGLSLTKKKLFRCEIHWVLLLMLCLGRWIKGAHAAGGGGDKGVRHWRMCGCIHYSELQKQVSNDC